MSKFNDEFGQKQYRCRQLKDGAAGNHFGRQFPAKEPVAFLSTIASPIFEKSRKL
jgi:hypothetical protein